MVEIKSFLNFLKTKKGIGFLLLALAIILNAVFLWSEVSVSTFSVNDDIIHFSVLKEASIALRAGQDPTDFWFSQLGLGFPFFHYYQHLPHIILVIINQFTSLFLSLFQLLDISRYLLLVLFPLSIFLAMRRFGFDYLASGISALVPLLISTNTPYGFNYGSYIWRGSGLYTQLWAMFFLPLALAEVYQVINKKGSLFRATLFSVIIFLSHLFYGYVFLLSTFLFLLIRPKRQEIFSRLKYLILLFFLVAVTTSYFFVPLFSDLEYNNSRSIWVPSWKYDSFGIQKVMTDLFKGSLLDFQRFPSLTLLFFIGILAIIISKRYKEEKHRFLLYFTAFWLILYFGKPTLGVLLKFLPFSNFLLLHRLIGVFHLGAIMIIGAGGALFFLKIKDYFSSRRSFLLIIIIIFVITLLYPVYSERISYYNENTRWRLQNQTAFSLNEKELLDIEQTLKDLPKGRVHAGMPAKWGNYPLYKIGFTPFYSIFPQLGIESFGFTFFSQPLSTDVRVHFDDTKPAQYNLFNIRYVLLHNSWTPAYYYSKIKEFENYTLYEVSTTGYFDLVDAPVIFYGKASDFYSPNSKWLFSSLPQLKQHPIIEIEERSKDISDLPAFSFQEVNEEILLDFASAQPERGQILSEKLDINEYWVRFETYRDCYLILKTNYHPGWEVDLDGKRQTPVMLSPGFIGIKVEPGTHQALFTYKPPSYRPFLLFLGIFILLILFFNDLRFLNKKGLKIRLTLKELGKRIKK